MARLMTLILILATLTCGSFGLKKDKFKIKAKGFGLKNLQAAPVAAAPVPYYAPAAPAAPAPYYPPAAPAAPAYPAAAPSGGYGGGGFSGGFNGGFNGQAATSASFTSGSAVAPHVVPVIIPIALMTQPQVSSAPVVSQPSLGSLSSFGSSGFGLGSQLGAQTYVPRVDLEYVPVTDMGSAAYGFSALNGNSFDSFNGADQFDTFGADGGFSNGFSSSGFSNGVYSG